MCCLARALFGGLALNRPLLPVLFDGALQCDGGGMAQAHLALGFLLLRAGACSTKSSGARRLRIVWGAYKTFGIMPLTILFALSQAPLIMRYEAKGDEADEASE